MERIDRSHIFPPYVLQHGRHVASFGRRHEEMNMVCHEHIRVYGAATAICRFAQAFKVKTPIDVAEKACSTIHPALDDMKRNPCEL
jgi:hypothetical protein